ncbi:uncharacterized protein LACBIDRAFT_296813 [Laccaria bicolor S238N-H82]|uniref:Predicted protein n=1 Tax=Laccaria bicolor (strain S238N-H82 / ATCC MYA-4686) TaxID=486041 RepID=B0E356_LACBS|nr:uncharacterized protein LACBIDRAFT_296813 [Laccaria bicolor S238N-H82]EDQ98726.1 predicted protein [Laccaria bicolor S238N-H82]|eukprot:XP_001890624.1 predicted protein [Laccaria bicolor S238N-H82]
MCIRLRVCLRGGELVHPIAFIDPTFTRMTSTFQVEKAEYYDNGHDKLEQWFGHFNVLRCYQRSASHCPRQTD